MTGVLSVSFFLISTLFSLIIFIGWLRFGLRYFRISQLHPIRQMIQRMTDPFFTPLLKTLQIHLTTFQRYDWLCFAALVGIEWLKFLIITQLYFNQLNTQALIAVYVFADLITQPCNLIFYALIIRVIMSWVNPNWQHPMNAVLCAVTEPMLQQIRRWVPNLHGVDFSPYLMMIILKIITLFVGVSLPYYL